MDNMQRIAVLIDADNTQLIKLEAVLHELTTYGRIVVKKAYGNWKKPTLKNWENEVKRLAIKAEQQFDYVSGKNTTDIVMVIDAMDLLHTGLYDAFALVSSDSDFTPLAIRLRESGAYIIGVGENKTPEAFRNACDDFLLLDYLTQADAPCPPPTIVPAVPAAVEPAPAPAADEPEPVEAVALPNIEDVHNLLRIAYERYQDEDGFVNVASAGTYIKRAKPDFTPRTYGYAKLPDLIAAFPKKYQMKRYRGKGTTDIVAYMCV